MEIDVLTIFPAMFSGPLNHSMLQLAQQRGLVTINLVDIRDYAGNRHRSVDDYPFGGGAGMVLQVEPVYGALQAVQNGHPETRIILLSPRGVPFSQAVAMELAQQQHLSIICGHYEGVDERVSTLVTDEISIGDYILTGGELAAMVVIDATVRLLPGVLGNQQATEEESFTRGLLEYPQYTRPRDYKGMQVPEVLLSGNHALIARWRQEQALRITWERRPELLERMVLSEAERILLQQWQNEKSN